MSVSEALSSKKHSYITQNTQRAKPDNGNKPIEISTKLNLIYVLITIAACSTLIYLGSEVTDPSWAQDFLISVGSVGIVTSVIKITSLGYIKKASGESEKNPVKVEIIKKEDLNENEIILRKVTIISQLIADLLTLSLMATLIYLGTEINTPSWAGTFLIVAGSIGALESLGTSFYVHCSCKNHGVSIR